MPVSLPRDQIVVREFNALSDQEWNEAVDSSLFDDLLRPDSRFTLRIQARLSARMKYWQRKALPHDW